MAAEALELSTVEAVDASQASVDASQASVALESVDPVDASQAALALAPLRAKSVGPSHFLARMRARYFRSWRLSF